MTIRSGICRRSAPGQVISARRLPMPSTWGSDLVCVCGLTYKAFRTNLNFATVRKMMTRAPDEPHTWLYKRRGGVLGYWHELKVEEWNAHIAACFAYAPASVVGHLTPRACRAVRPLKGQSGTGRALRRPPRRAESRSAERRAS